MQECALYFPISRQALVWGYTKDGGRSLDILPVPNAEMLLSNIGVQVGWGPSGQHISLDGHTAELPTFDPQGLDNDTVWKSITNNNTKQPRPFIHPVLVNGKLIQPANLSNAASTYTFTY